MKKILLIEDDQTLRENTKELLEMLNYLVLDAANGKMGVELAVRYQPDLILCDILMPELDGYGVFEALHQIDSTSLIPFIFLSAKAEAADVRKGMNLGADDYLTKPFLEKDLIDAIESRLAKYFILKEKREKIKEEKTAAISSMNQLLDYFQKKGEICKCAKNKIIYEENKNADYVYLLDKGLVKTHRMDEYGKELITGVYNKGNFFGYYCFRNMSSYPETATVLEKSMLYRIPHTEFNGILSKNHQLTIELAQLLSDNLSTLKEHLLEMAYGSVLKKTTNTILQFAELMKDKSQDEIKISRSDLASVAGISTESFIRSLSSLKKDGVIDIEGRSIKILNMDKLQSIR